MANTAYVVLPLMVEGTASHRDAELVAGHNDEFDVRRFVEKYQDLVVNTCDHFVNDLDDAKDIAQQVFMASLRVSKRINTDTEWRAWLYRVSVNRSLDFLRSRKRHRWLQSLTGKLVGGTDPNNVAAIERDRPDRELELAELRRALESAVAKLPDRQRTAFVLNRHEGLTNSEIAEVMKLRPNAVDALLHRAITTLRKRLVTHYKEFRQP